MSEYNVMNVSKHIMLAPTNYLPYSKSHEPMCPGNLHLICSTLYSVDVIMRQCLHTNVCMKDIILIIIFILAVSSHKYDTNQKKTNQKLKPTKLRLEIEDLYAYRPGFSLGILLVVLHHHLHCLHHHLHCLHHYFSSRI